MDGGRSRRTPSIAVAVGVLAVLLGTVAFFARRSANSPAASTPASTGAREPAPSARLPPTNASPRQAPTADTPPPGSVPSAMPGESRKERAQRTLAAYLDWARYPPASRPARERPDRQRPHAAPARKLPLSRRGGPSSKVSLVLSQSHAFLAGDEVAALTLSCRQGDDPLPCTVTGASALAGPGATGGLPSPVPVAFLDDGAAPDRTANDGVWTAAVAPAKMGFADLLGPLAITAEVSAADESGTGQFQLSYTAHPPAIFTGAVRETLERGSLSLCVGMRVAEAGRYVLDARVDEAGGEPFAFVSFNDVLAAGEQEACFTVFGRLVLDEGAVPTTGAAPLRMRDLEGFLLLEDASPDRRTVPTRDGLVHTTKPYSTSDFAAAEWQSPEKDRHVAHLKEVADSAE